MAVRMKLVTPQAMIEILSNIRTESLHYISQKLIDESIAAIQKIFKLSFFSSPSR